MAKRKDDTGDGPHINVGGDATGATFIAGDTVNINPSKTTVFGHVVENGAAADTGTNEGQAAEPAPDQLALFGILRDTFTLEELENAAWELGIRFDDLPAKTLSAKARQLVERAAALGKLDKLKVIVRRERPGANLGD